MVVSDIMRFVCDNALVSGNYIHVRHPVFQHSSRRVLPWQHKLLAQAEAQ